MITIFQYMNMTGKTHANEDFANQSHDIYNTQNGQINQTGKSGRNGKRKKKNKKSKKAQSDYDQNQNNVESHNKIERIEIPEKNSNENDQEKLKGEQTYIDSREENNEGSEYIENYEHVVNNESNEKEIKEEKNENTKFMLTLPENEETKNKPSLYQKLVSHPRNLLTSLGSHSNDLNQTVDEFPAETLDSEIFSNSPTHKFMKLDSSKDSQKGSKSGSQIIHEDSSNTLSVQEYQSNSINKHNPLKLALKQSHHSSQTSPTKDSIVDTFNDAKKEIFKRMKLTVNAMNAMNDTYEVSPTVHNQEVDSAVKHAMKSVVDDFSSCHGAEQSPCDEESITSRDTYVTCKDTELDSPFPTGNTELYPKSSVNVQNNISTLHRRNDTPLVLSFSLVLKRFLKVFILTYGFRSTFSIIGSLFSELRLLLQFKKSPKELLTRGFIKQILVHESRAPYEAAMRIGIFCAGICSIYEGAEMLIRWIWFTILKRSQNLIRNQKVVFQIEKLRSQHIEEEQARRKKNVDHSNENPARNPVDSIDIRNQESRNELQRFNSEILLQDNEKENHLSQNTSKGTFGPDVPISTTPNGEEIIIYTKTKTIQYAPRLHWHTAIAGFASGLALYAIKDPESKRTISLYFFARLLQCVYNGLKQRGHFNKILPKFEHYDSLLFMISTAQIMYAWVARRFALPPSYARFITKTGPIHQPVLDTVEAIHTHGESVENTLPTLTKYLSKYYPAEKAKYLVDEIQKTNRVDCSVLHPMQQSCTRNYIRVSLDVTRKIFPLYGVLTLVSLLILKRKSIISSPAKTIGQGLFNVCRSTAFLSTFVASYQYFICGQRKLTSGIEHRFIYWFAGFFASAAIFLEQKPRRSELALYVLPRGLDALYLILQRRKWLSTIPFGELLLFCLSLSGIMVANFHERETLGSLPRFILKTFFSNQIVKWIE